jgi:hypothetical protein
MLCSLNFTWVSASFRAGKGLGRFGYPHDSSAAEARVVGKGPQKVFMAIVMIVVLLSGGHGGGLAAQAGCWTCDVIYYEGDDCYINSCVMTDQHGYYSGCAQTGGCDWETCETQGEICNPAVLEELVSAPHLRTGTYFASLSGTNSLWGCQDPIRFGALMAARTSPNSPALRASRGFASASERWIGIRRDG